MKNLIITLLLVFYSAGVFAHDRYRNRYSHRIYDRSVHWVVPAMAGVVVGTIVTKQYYSPHYPQNQYVYIEREPQIHCSEWREIQQESSTIIRERYCIK